MNPPRGVRDTGGSRRGDLPSTKTFKAPRRLATGKNKSASIPLVWFRSLGTRISSAAEGVVSLNSGKLLHHSFIEINDTALDLLENKSRGQDFRYGSNKKSRILSHWYPCDNVRHPMGYHALVAVVVDAGKVSRDPCRLAIGVGVLANVRRDGF